MSLVLVLASKNQKFSLRHPRTKELQSHGTAKDTVSQMPKTTSFVNDPTLNHGSTTKLESVDCETQRSSHAQEFHLKLKAMTTAGSVFYEFAPLSVTAHFSDRCCWTRIQANCTTSSETHKNPSFLDRPAHTSIRVGSAG